MSDGDLNLNLKGIMHHEQEHNKHTVLLDTKSQLNYTKGTVFQHRMLQLNFKTIVLMVIWYKVI